MKEVPSFIDRKSRKGIQVYQLTDDPKGATLIYPDQPCFLRGGRRMVIHSSLGPAICDLEDDGRLRPIFDDGSAPSVSVTFDGRYGYYVRTRSAEDRRVVVSRVDLDTLMKEDVFEAQGALRGTDISADKVHTSTVSSDNRRVAFGTFLGDGKTMDAPYGIFALDLDLGEAALVAAHKDFGNPHLQYCRSTDAEASHDLLVQMNHGARSDERGRYLVGLGPPSDLGVDVHVVRDDGTNWRDMPFGRDGKESCIGHQVWRGNGVSAATVTLQNMDTSYGWADGSAQGVVAGWAGPADFHGPHLGARNPGARRVDLAKGFRKPRFCHLACDATGLRFALDTFPIFDGKHAGMQVYIGSAPDEQSPLKMHYLLNTGITFNTGGGYHAHPILSPDGHALFFNSRVTGTSQAYMVTHLEY